MKRILITGAGAPGGPGIIKALRTTTEVHVLVADADENACGRFLVNSFEKIPHANDAGFIPEVLRICEKHAIDVIFPLVTKELFHLARHKKTFAAKGIRIIVSDDEMLQLANNKRMLYEHLQRQQIITPEFFVVHSPEAFMEAAAKLGYPEKPFCFKPSVSNGSRGFRVVSQQVNEMDLLFNYKPNNTFMAYEKAVEILSSGPFPEILVTEYLPGEEYTVDALLKDGELKLMLPRHRLQMREGISIRGEFVAKPEIMDYTKAILGSMHLHGPVGVQMKQGADGLFKILEINPRIQGTSVAAMGLDINLPLMAVLQEFNQDITVMPEQIRWGTKFVRYYQEVFY